MSFVRDYWVSISLSVAALLVLVVSVYLEATVLSSFSDPLAYVLSVASVAALAVLLTLGVTAARKPVAMTVGGIPSNDPNFWGEKDAA